MLTALLPWAIRKRRLKVLTGRDVSAATSTLTLDSFSATSGTWTYTPRDADGNALGAGVPWSIAVDAEARVSAALSTVSAAPGTIANDGVESSTITSVLIDEDGDFVVGFAAASTVLSVSTTTGNTLTQPASASTVYGVQTSSFVTTNAATKTASITAAGRLITDTASVVATGGSITYPNEPSGYTRFVETDYSAQPADPLPTDGAGQTLESPTTNITLEVTPTRMRYHHIAGTQPGYSPPSYALFSMWDTASQLSSTEYSEVYMYDEITLVGNGGTYETPTVGFKFLGYFGYGLNNQNGSGAGPVQGYHFARPVSVDSSTPAQASEFYWDIRTQITGTAPGNRDLPQNLNTGTHIVVGTKHVCEVVFKLNTVGSANGEAHWWIDGVKVGEYTDVQWIDSSFANAGYGAKANGLAGFFGRYYDLVWGGSGGANKTRDDATDFHKTYISGVYLRAANP